jgi:hypothetical protein
MVDHTFLYTPRRRAAPICKICIGGMKWSRSSLDASGREIIHVFACLQCGAIAKTETPVDIEQ